MSNAKVLASEGSESVAGRYLIEGLPPWMPTDAATGNFKLLDVVGRAIDRLDHDIEDIDHASTVQHATTIAHLKRLAQLVDTPPKTGEAREKYRSRVIARFQTLTSEGTPADIIGNTATVLDVEPEDIEYTELTENGVVSLGIPAKSLSDLSMSDTEFVDIVKNHVAAGYRIEATTSGTFTYAAPGDELTITSDKKGYDADADADGVPDQTADSGTYAGLIN